MNTASCKGGEKDRRTCREVRWSRRATCGERRWLLQTRRCRLRSALSCGQAATRLASGVTACASLTSRLTSGGPAAHTCARHAAARCRISHASHTRCTGQAPRQPCMRARDGSARVTVMRHCRQPQKVLHACLYMHNAAGPQCQPTTARRKVPAHWHSARPNQTDFAFISKRAPPAARSLRSRPGN